jgi:thiosulfate dehydrogenase (quinone) large subunit
MSVIHRHTPARHATAQHGGTTESTTTPLVQDEVVTTSFARRALAVLRIAFGFTFLWAFLDKTFALGFHTGWVTNPETGEETLDRFGDAAWINGGSPTEGFLSFGVNPDSPFAGFFNDLAGYAIVDWMFMLGLLGIGLALTLGVGMRIGAIAGAVMYLMMYAAVMVPENNPIFDDHLIGAISVVVLAATLAGDTWGLGRRWGRTDIVQKYPVLK